MLLLLSLRSVLRKQRAKTYFKGKHVWVTGASSGIGQQVAQELALRGARVTMSARSRRKMSAMAKELVSDGFAATCVPLDVSEAYATIATAHRTAVGNYGPVDILIANAGINNRGNKFAELSEDTIEQVISTNFKGTVYCVKAVLPTMIQRKKGLVASVSSLSGYRGLPRGSVYGGTKAAISNFMEAVRVELWGSGIKVNICGFS
ncbi:hypothetical protein NDN08_003502 [Rhodosorus marinus]|uniref:Uncharacterized protein n=1 Tax=Rhodosorus marinus TaxID=101924 RepID=A0AAV8UWY4_9RHOD|nr:hypothetical protein NDN08_003502 [Rhodosorus marinus]